MDGILEQNLSKLHVGKIFAKKNERLHPKQEESN